MQPNIIIKQIGSVNSIIENKYPDAKKALTECLQPYLKKDIKTLHKCIDKIKSFQYDENTYREIYNLINMLYDPLIDNNKNALFEYNQQNVLEAKQHFDLIKDVEIVGNNTVTITMTTCKRNDLLKRTINSFLECVLDYQKYVTKWIIIDDNSSQEQRDEMKQLYPFITYIFKTPEQKGHPISMNMLLENVDTKYMFNIEDDWEFFKPDNYIGQMISVFNENNKFGQVLMNVNYSEDTKSASSLWGSRMKYSNDGIRYFIHNYYTGNELEKMNKLTGMLFSNCYYWPHFSFRVGLTDTSVFKNVGPFDTKAKHFEMEYAYRYTSKGYLTAFLDGTFCGHIGRRTYERNTEKLNAYDLNNEQQFGDKPKETEKSVQPKQPQQEVTEISVQLINLKRRRDRLVEYFEKNKHVNLPLNIFEACDGKLMKPSGKIQKAFSTGDYNYRSGIIGCAMSHTVLWKNFLNDLKQDYLLVLEDDIQLCSDFQTKVLHLVQTYKNQFEILFLHFNPYQHAMNPEYFSDKNLIAELWSVERSMRENMGSTAGYIISRQGAKNMLLHIKENGMRNAIDWNMFKSPLNKTIKQRVMYSKPMLIKANCFQTPGNGVVDTDIQTDFSTLKYKKDDDWDVEELQYLVDILLLHYLNQSSSKVDIIIKTKNEDKVKTIIKNLKKTELLKNPKRYSTIIFSDTVDIQQCREYIVVYPLEQKEKLKQMIQYHPIKWYYTNQFLYCIPEKFLNEKFIEDKVWGEDLLNTLKPF